MIERHTRWFYDGGEGTEPEPGQRGQLHQVIQSRGKVDESCVSQNYCQTYAYDELGRQSGTFTFHPTDPKTGADADTGYVTSTSYDAIGRPYVQQDALSGLVHGRSGVHYRYDRKLPD